MPSPSYPACLDTQLLGWIQDAILEPNNGGQSLATNQFTISQLVNCVNQASLDLQRDTGIVAEHLGFEGDTLDGIGATPEEETIQLPQDMMDVRRRAWISFNGNPLDLWGLTFYDNITPRDSGDHQHFTLPTAPSPVASLELYLNGQILEPQTSLLEPNDYALSGKNLTLTTPLAGTWNLEAYFRVDGASQAIFFDDITPLDSGDHRTFTLPALPNPPLSLKLFLNGQLLRPILYPGGPGDYTLTALTVLLKNALDSEGDWVLQAWFRVSAPPIYYDDVAPKDLGDHQHFVLPAAPWPTASLELYLNGQLLEIGADYGLSGVNVTLASPLAGTWNLQAYFRWYNNAANVTAVVELPVQDALALDSTVPDWEEVLGTPWTSNESLPPVPALDVSPQPQDVGELDLIYTPVPNQLSNTGVALSFPPDFAVAVFYRAMAILYGLQGEGADDQRARYCTQRYELLVALSKALLYMPGMVPIEGAG